jgi:hypothetical protein
MHASVAMEPASAAALQKSKRGQLCLLSTAKSEIILPKLMLCCNTEVREQDEGV